MSQNQQTSKAYFKNLNRIHLAMLGGMVLFVIVALYLELSQTGLHLDENKGAEIYFMIVAILTVSGILGSKLLYESLTKKAQKKEDIIEKMQAYQSAVIVRFAILEGATLFAIVVFLLASEMLVLAFAAVLLLFFVGAKPTKQKAITDLRLNKENQKMVEDDNAIVSEN
jgi:hypothetical protein